MDVFVFPSLFEGFGIAFLEAQATGLKCVVSNNIANEAHIVKNNIVEISLKKKATFWAEKITNIHNFERKDVTIQIKNAGYDIQQNAKKLEKKIQRTYPTK